VHAAYKRYRKALLRSQVEVYELKPYPGTQGPSTALRGSSRAGLHAKTFAFDDRAIFVGSMNLDPRSVRLNTEVGVLVESPQLATRLTRKVMEDIANRAYHLRMEGRRVVWLTNEAGRSVRFTTEPETSAWQRLKTAIVGLLPIEGQL
jgi:putative cardiolipin synthase